MAGTSTSSPTPLTFKQRVFLVAVVPAFFLCLLEGSARVLELVGVAGSKQSAPMALEMPTWMLHDANAMARATPSKDAFDWLNLFVEGQGYRVHLIPNTTREVKNTFSLIPADASRRYRITSNSIGFRGPNITPEKDPTTFRILVFGDSSSFGWGVNAEDSWSVLLQQALEERAGGQKIEVANFAIPGDSSAYGRLIFDTFAPRYQADLVILGFGANDAKRVSVSHTDQVAKFERTEGLLEIAKVLKHSALYRVLDNLLQRSKQPASASNRQKVAAVNQHDYAANLSYMGNKAKELGSANALFLALCTPNNYARVARTEAKQGGFLWFNGQTQLIRQLPEIESGKLYPEYVQQMQVSYPEDLERNRLFYITSDGCHPNELGHRFVADRLATIITKSGVMQ